MMLLTKSKLFILICLVAAFTACQGSLSNTATIPVPRTETTTAGVPVEATHILQVPTSTLPSGLKGQVILADQEVNEFGWLPDGRIYYEIRDGERSVWHAYDVASSTSENFLGPHPAMDFFINKPSVQILADNPGMDPDMYNAMTQNGDADLITVALSPSGKAAVYTRLPIGFVRPTTEPHYIDPLDLWVVSEGGKKNFMAKEQFSYKCGGSLDPQSRWFFDETLVIGSCGDYDRYFFFVDLLSQKLRFINFDVTGVNKMEMEDPRIAPLEEIDVAHQSLSLVFTYGGLWIVPVDKGVRSFPESLNDSSVYIPNTGILSPRWSTDDQWVYYWRIGDISGYDEHGFAQRPWWLEKINVESREMQVVLKPDELRAIVGNELYALTMGNIGDHMTWQLSPDGHQALLFMDNTIASPYELFLLSW